jgi:hypothetical protein
VPSAYGRDILAYHEQQVVKHPQKCETSHCKGRAQVEGSTISVNSVEKKWMLKLLYVCKHTKGKTKRRERGCVHSKCDVLLCLINVFNTHDTVLLFIIRT